MPRYTVTVIVPTSVEFDVEARDAEAAGELGRIAVTWLKPPDRFVTGWSASLGTSLPGVKLLGASIDTEGARSSAPLGVEQELFG